MVKATLRSAVLLALAAIGMLAVSMPSFAEVQNIKVGGDITVRAFHRENMDLHQEDEGGALAEQLDNEDDFLMNTVGLNVGADLTENVQAFVRIANERTLGSSNVNTAQGDIDISQGYIKIKELFYSPLDLTIGTQPIVWGRGFVLGSNLIPSIVAGADRNTSILADEFTDFTAFDAIRLSGDFGGTAAMDMPLTFDAVYIKSAEGTVGNADDTNIMGVNLGTRFDTGEMETYYLNKRDRSSTTGENHGSVSTLGVRGSVQPDNGANVYGELAYQFGQRAADPTGFGLVSGDSQQAWAINLGGDLTFQDVATSPKLGGEWIFWSGKDIEACNTIYCGGVHGWDPIARGSFTTVLREFQTAASTGFYATDQTFDTGSASNQHQLALYGSMKPIEDLTIAPRVTWFILNRGVIPYGANGKRESYAGFEWDTVATYNYTDDVQLGLIYALFFPGSVYRSPNNSTAQELITSVSVKF